MGDRKPRQKSRGGEKSQKCSDTPCRFKLGSEQCLRRQDVLFPSACELQLIDQCSGCVNWGRVASCIPFSANDEHVNALLQKHGNTRHDQRRRLELSRPKKHVSTTR